jgi:uracil-DNA glycosylase
MSQETSAATFLPAATTLGALRKAATSCRGCDLYKRATMTVFGEGPESADIVFVGEQPGDQEDRSGHPFVGPAGHILDRALKETRLRRDQVYVTNAVKHFKWLPLGKRRKHQKPSVREVEACRPWLEAEVSTIQPKVVVCLGSTAAQAMLDRPVGIERERGTFQETPRGVTAFVTIHPSAILRFPDPEQREREYARFLKDLTLVHEWVLRRHASEPRTKRGTSRSEPE